MIPLDAGSILMLRKLFIFTSFLFFKRPEILDVAFQGSGDLIGSVNLGHCFIVDDIAQMMPADPSFSGYLT